VSESSWRDSAAPIIARVLADTRYMPEKDIRAALHRAYPFGMRKYHPYKIWLDEIARQRGTKPKLGTFGPKKKAVATDPRQERLDWSEEKNA
jgi:hypothetical protein